MPNYYSPETIQKLLDTYSKNRTKVRDYKAPEFETLVPKEMDTNYQPEPLYDRLQNSILDRAKVATEIALTKAQNRRDYQTMLQARRQARIARQNYVAPSQNHYGGGPSSPGTVSTVRGTNWGADHIPEVSDIGQLQPHGPLTTINLHGRTVVVNKQVAPIFMAFLNNLWSTGYRPKSISGYANRNIAGTNTPSLHSYGFAIDIDPGRNPVTWNGHNITALPPGVGAMAARYGLVWGGSWHGSKRDTMHFSVPYGGTL